MDIREEAHSLKRAMRSPDWLPTMATAVALLCLGGAPGRTLAAEGVHGGAQACAALQSRAGGGVEVQTAEWVPASRIPSGPGNAVPAPEHCLVRLMVGARPSGLPDLSYGTGIELRMPREWNGRLLFQGGGGLNGVLLPAVGRVTGFPSALERGFAVVSTDGGHRGRNNIDARFGVDQQARLDFAYQAVERTTHLAKSFIDAFYGRRPERSYFMGCSTGGREAMLAAQRLPLEFDGVVAGNPSWNLTRIAANQIWSLQTVMGIAPRDASGRPDPSRAFSDVQLQAVAAAALKRCDALDGLADGLIHDFRACDFHPRQLECGATDAPGPGQCLSKEQVTALDRIFGGARDPAGRRLYGSFPWDTGIAGPAWRGMHLGTQGGQPANATLGAETLRWFALTPPDPDLDPLQFEFGRDFDRTLETAAINDANGTQHTTFAARGGKLIVYHGLSDQGMSTESLVDWYERLTPRADGGAQSWARLFLVPGMSHCGGGQSTDRFDMLEAVQAWVEHGRAPDRVLASGAAFPGRTRPLCPYPTVARYVGGNPEDAASFACR